MRIATFNIRHGLGADDRVDNRRLAKAIGSLHADVLGLQEVDQFQTRSGNVNQMRICAEGMGALYGRFQPTLVGPFHRPGMRRARRAEQIGLPGYGIALLSRFPVLSWNSVLLPVATPWVGGRVPLGTDEPRVALTVQIDTPVGVWTVVCTHLSVYRIPPVTGMRRLMQRVIGRQEGVPGGLHAATQIDYLQHWLKGVPRPLIVLGDLNMRGTAPTDQTGWRSLTTHDTFPRRDPRFRIDHILWDGEPSDRTAGLITDQSVDTGVSDHRALIVDLE